MSDEMTTIAKAAKISGISPQLLRIYCRAGVFPGARKFRGTRWLIPREDLDDLVSGEVDVSGIHDVNT